MMASSRRSASLLRWTVHPLGSCFMATLLREEPRPNDQFRAGLNVARKAGLIRDAARGDLR
jgi:hypothetical protein